MNFFFCVALTVSSMIGIGVYTSLGFQVAGIRSVSAILILWVLGGVIALCGALVYSELAAKYPGSGGEYNYLSRTVHPVAGFLSGWVSVTAGFPAPIAAMSIAFARYLATLYPGVNQLFVAYAVVGVITLINILGLKSTVTFKKIIFVVNISMILTFIFYGLSKPPIPGFNLSLNYSDIKYILNPAFAVSLVYVMYSYSGWNSATYVAGEIKNPNRVIPYALVIATTFVTAIYTMFNLVFLRAVPMNDLQGKIEVAQIAASSLWGHSGLIIISTIIMFGLMAAINSMFICGSHVCREMLKDNYKVKNTSLIIPILFQSMVAIILISTATFEQVIIYMGFTLSTMNTTTVASVFIARKRFPEHKGYKTPLYPLTPIIFILLQTWMMFFLLKETPKESLMGVLTLLIGVALYYSCYFNRRKTNIG